MEIWIILTSDIVFMFTMTNGSFQHSPSSSNHKSGYSEFSGAVVYLAFKLSIVYKAQTEVVS